ncbi:MAG TPA: MBL fold metallo-hydrolase [Anaerolineae bacterium]|nr:MBL fold metallo-hydrolase [Anaerolineae bacterium]
MRHLLFVNGLEAPLSRLFGCECGRCLDPARKAHTSVSLISLDDAGEIVHHILFDIGLGVADSLFANPYLAHGRARLDWLCLTHWHPDHTAGMNQLLVSWYVNNLYAEREWKRPSLWCRSGTAVWLERMHNFEIGLTEMFVSGEDEPPGTVLPSVPLSLDGLTVTPVTVAHFNGDKDGENPAERRYSCAAFVLQTAVTKTVLLWDLDSSNEWLVTPQTAREETAVALLSHADYLFVDTAFWQAKDRLTSHPTFTNVQRYAASLRPRQTFLIHLSGHPDGPGNGAWGWTNGRWQTEAQTVWREKNLPGSVHVPAIGDCFEL